MYKLVYTRRILRGNKNITNKNNPPNSFDAIPSVNATANNQTNEKWNNPNPDISAKAAIAPENCPKNVTHEGKNNDHIAYGSNPKETNDGKEGNSSQPQPNSTHSESSSEDSLILNRIEPPVPSGHDASVVSGSVVTLVDDRVKISVSGACSKEGARELKRKLVDELSQVRKMAKILEGKKIQISGIDVGVVAPAVSSLRSPVSGGLGKGSSGGGRIRFRQLSVSVMENNRGTGEGVEKEKRTPKANRYYRSSEFILGKDRLPPAGSKKKSKSTSKKHCGREIDSGFGIDTPLYTKCSKLLKDLMGHQFGWVFNEPVNVKTLGLHDYFDIIKHPMDLGTVKMRLIESWYKTPREFAEDVRLTFHNAMTYNPPGQDVHLMAEKLLMIFEKKWPAIETEYRDMGVPTPTSTKSCAPAHVYPPLSPPPLLHKPPSFQNARKFGRSQSMPVTPESRPMPAYIVGRTPALKKPKARDPNKRDMTTSEKTKLGVNLECLPAEKLEAVVQIIKKRGTTLSQHNDEVEVDIDGVDTETLWELDRFVTNYKKNLSKRKSKVRRGLLPISAQPAQQTIPAPVNIETVQETREGEANDATSPHDVDKQEKHGDNASDSGSSSSDSDSSSSSSSSSGSDGGQ